jgi:hypothetical protein
MSATIASPISFERASAYFEKRQTNQAARIAQGVESGALTGEEAQRLEARQTRLGERLEKAQADGKFTVGELAGLRRSFDGASAGIYRAKHNGQVSIEA